MLDVGTEAMIEMSGGKGTAVVRGWRIGEGGYLLVERPNGNLPMISAGKEAVVRIKRNGILYGATVRFEEQLKKTNLFYLPFSQDIIAVSLRKVERVSCILPVTVRKETGDDAPGGA